MVALDTPLLWYTTRATGVVALVLFSGTVVLGILTSTRAASEAWPRFAVSDLHRRISMVALVFLVLHILTAVVDSYVAVGWLAVVVPFTSGYQPLWVGMGTVAFDLLLAVLVSSLLRSRLRPSSWRAIHWLAYLSWPVAVAHGIGIGTDLRFGWMDVVTGACVGAVVAAGAWRVWAHPGAAGLRTAAPRRRPLPRPAPQGPRSAS